MGFRRSLLRRIANQVIYIIVVAVLVALSLKAFSNEDIKQPNYHSINEFSNIK